MKKIMKNIGIIGLGYLVMVVVCVVINLINPTFIGREITFSLAIAYIAIGAYKYTKKDQQEN